MPKAILKNGLIYPLDPLPPDWTDGMEVWVDSAKNGTEQRIIASCDLEAAWDELETLCMESDLEDEVKMQAAIDEHRRQAKLMMRREMELHE